MYKPRKKDFTDMREFLRASAEWATANMGEWPWGGAKASETSPGSYSILNREHHTMTDEEAINIAKLYGVRHGPIITIPPRGAVDEITKVDLRDWSRPIVTREPSKNYGPGQ